MRKRRIMSTAITIFALLLLSGLAAAQTTVYNAVPATLAPNYPSQPFQAQQTFEFGDYVHLAGSDRIAKGVTITMSEWALQSTPGNQTWCTNNPGKCSAAGWQYPFTLNIYAAGPVVGGLNTKGALLGSITQVKTVPWRPEADPSCGTAWLAPDNQCYNGYAFNMTFDFSNYYLNLPNDVIVGLAFNTQTWGANPTGVDGPYNSLNVALPPSASVPSVGTDESNDRVFWNTVTAADYTDGGAGGVGIFREDTGWFHPGSPDFNGTVPLQITATATPNQQVVNVGAGSLTSTPNYTQWFFYNDETDVIDNSLGSFVNGPGTPFMGRGSAQISVSGTQRRNLATYQFAATPLSSIGTLKFSTYNPSAGNGGGSTRSGYLNFNVDFTGSSSSFQGRLVYVPNQNGTVVPDTWKEWDAINGGNALWSYSRATWPAGIGGGGEPGTTLKSWSQVLSQYPNSRIQPIDSWLGIRVGEPYADGYTENIDTLTFGTANTLTAFNFDPLPTTVYVDDSWTGTAPGADPDGAGPATAFGYDAFAKIQDGINGVDAGGTVNVAGGTYNEDLLVNKTVVLNGAGPSGVVISGPKGGAGSTLAIAAGNVEVRGFTITRDGNNTADWNDANGVLNSAGISIQGQAITGANIHDNYITGNRTGIDINNSNGHSIHNNVIDFNRTGLIFRNQTDNLNVTENQITNNWTVGVLFLDGSGGTNSPVQTALSCSFFDNSISGNWYGQIVDRQSGGSLPAPATTNLKNFSGNWFGSAAPVVTTANSTEPGYAAEIPVAYGGGATAPGGQPDIAGPASANFDYSPYLAFGGDVAPATYGFQGNFSALNVSAGSAQTQATSKIQEANDLMTGGGTLTVPAGTYPGNVNITKAINVKGTFTVGGTFTLSAPDAQVSPGTSPGIINTGNFSMTSGTTFNAELNGPNVGSQYDQVNVTGTVSLGDATLNATLGFTPTVGQVFTIINNDSTDAVTGTFSGLPEGTVFSIGGNTFRISYVGGTGNDVTLTDVSLCNAVSIPTTYTVLTGQTVTAQVNVDDTTGHGLYSTDLWLSYDPSVVTIANVGSVSLGTVDSSGSLTVNNSTPGLLKVSVFSATPFSGAGTLLNITFTANGLPGTQSAVSFTQFKFNEGTPCVTTSNGLVKVVSGTITGAVTYGNPIGLPATRAVPNTTLSAVGSVNQSATTDGSGNYTLSGFGSGAYDVTPSKTGDSHSAISGFDSAFIAQYVVGLIGLNASQQSVADVSGTGGITSFDAALIARYVVSLPNSGSTGTWKFVPTSRHYTDVNTNQTAQDYSALLMGDVTGNWDTGGVTVGQFTSSSFAGGGPAIPVAMPTLKASQGTTVSVPINVGNLGGQGILAYDFDVTYDPAVLEPVASGVDTADTESAKLFITTNPSEPGHMRVVAFGITPMSGNGSLVNLTFNVIGGVGTQTDVGYGSFRFNEGGMQLAMTQGHVTVDSAAGNSASLSGRVLSTTGQGVRNARVTITDTTGVSRSVLTNTFGYYQFADVPTGATYNVAAAARGLSFSSRTVSVTSLVTQLDLIADK